MQNKKSIILNKLLFCATVSQGPVGKVVQETCWFLPRAETSGCSQKGEL